MFDQKKMIAPLAAFCLLCGCAGNTAANGGSKTAEASPAEMVSAADTSAAETAPDNDKPAETAAAEGSPATEQTVDTGIYTDVPLLTIVTKNQNKGVMRFVDEPVAKQVSASVASWTPGYVRPPEPYYEECTVTLTDTDGTVLTSGDAQVKVRGNWTTLYDKKPLRIKFDEKQSMGSLNGGAECKNWVLLAEYKDISMLRNKAALSAAREILGADGYYAADAQFAEVIINGDYRGMYLLTEQQQINPNRVDITEAEKDYGGTDIGYLLEYDGNYKEEDTLNQFWVNYDKLGELIPYDGNGGSGKTITCLSGGRNDVGISIKSDIYSKEQHDFIANFVRGVYEIMYHASYDNEAYVFTDDYSEIVKTDEITPFEAVERVVDVQSLADSYIICELACDADIYWSSFFMDVDFGEGGSRKLTFEAPWDFDSTMGLKNRCTDAQGLYAANIVYDVNDSYKTINPWLAVLTQREEYINIVKQRWAKAYSDGVFERMIDMVNSDAEDLAAAFDRNYERWDNIRNNGAANEFSNNTRKCHTHKEAAEQLSDWLTKRVEFLNTAFS